MVGSQGADLGKSACTTCEKHDLRPFQGVMKRDEFLSYLNQNREEKIQGNPSNYSRLKKSYLIQENLTSVGCIYKICYSRRY